MPNGPKLRPGCIFHSHCVRPIRQHLHLYKYRVCLPQTSVSVSSVDSSVFASVSSPSAPARIKNNPGNQTCSHWPKSAVSAGRRSEWKKRLFFLRDIFVLRWKEAAFEQEKPNHGRIGKRWSKKGQYLLKILVIFWTRCLCEVLVNHQAADYWKCVWVLLLHTWKNHSTYSIIQCVGSSMNKQSQYKQTELNAKVQLYIKTLLTYC